MPKLFFPHFFFIAILLAPISTTAQCPSNSLLLNGSFEAYDCCPDWSGQMMCVVNWQDTLMGSADYYNDCNFNGHSTFRPPPGYPDGQACVGYYTANGGGEHLSTCILTPLELATEYKISAYFGFNEENSVPSLPSPAKVVLYGKIESCAVTYINNGLCPMDYDSIAEITFVYTDEVGWVYGESECFEVALEYNHFVIGAACNETMNGFVFLDLFELTLCAGPPNIDIIIGPACDSRADGFIDITVFGGTPPYLFDWDFDGTGDFDDEEDLDSLVAGNYVITVMDANGLFRCLNIRVPQLAIEPPLFGPIGPFCVGDPMVTLPTTSSNYSPITGTWNPATVNTDVAGVYNYVFAADSAFCADTVDD